MLDNLYSNYAYPVITVFKLNPAEKPANLFWLEFQMFSL